MAKEELIWNEVNCTTGEVITRPFTDEERAAWETKQAEMSVLKAEQEAEALRIASLKDSAKAKLIAGTPLTEDEAALLVI
jgi:hypothetical protein